MKHKSILIIILIGIGISLPLSWTSFETVARGGFCGHLDKKDYIIDTQSEWEELWEITVSIFSPRPKLPAIDFSENIIIAVYLGRCSSGGYTIEIMNRVSKRGA